MPELPEVETIKRGLEKYLLNHTVQSIEVRLPKMFVGDSTTLNGSTIVSVRRFGKGLVIDFSNNYSIAIHVKMTGQLIYQGRNAPEGTVHKQKVGQSLPTAYTHIIMQLDTGNLFYNDIRQFGWWKVIKTSELKTIPFFKDLGREPLRDLSYPYFRDILKNRKSLIKSLLMDQKLIAGVGNIYANDALYLAKIHPKRPANSLSDGETKVLFNAIEIVLKKGIEVGGASEWQYVNALGQTGNYQNFFQVYGKNGSHCSRCKTIIERIKMGGRGTFFCSKCQK